MAKVIAILSLLCSIAKLRAVSGFNHRSEPLISKNSPSQSVSSATALWQQVPRRQFLSLAGGIPAALLLSFPSIADDYTGDASMSMFNPDGSLKQEIETEAKFRITDITWDPSIDNYLINVDGENAGHTRKGSKLRLSYELPEKWTNQYGTKYYDQSEKASACSRIIVYQAPGSVTIERLEKASSTGIAKALEILPDLQPLYSADLISGGTTTKDGQKYFEFDCAVAPKSCSNSQEDLGLGFCPYDTIYLLSATEFDGRLYVMVVESGKSEWKRANSDLKRVRSSFTVKVDSATSSA